MLETNAAPTRTRARDEEMTITAHIPTAHNHSAPSTETQLRSTAWLVQTERVTTTSLDMAKAPVPIVTNVMSLSYPTHQAFETERHNS